MCWWYNLSLVSFHFVSKWHNMFQSKNSIVLSSVLFKYVVMAGECVCSLGFIRAWMIGAITLGIWITLLIWIVLIVIMSHRSWCYRTSMRNRSFVRLKIKEISFQKWHLTKLQKKYEFTCPVLSGASVNCRISSFGCDNNCAASNTVGSWRNRDREIIGASIMNRCSCATVLSCGNSIAGARNIYENG